MEKTVEITDFEREQLLRLQDLLDFNVHNWNEAELDSHFIGPLFALVNFSSYDFNHFGQRDIKGTVEDWRLFGEPDGMIASGRRAPETPYFAFQVMQKSIIPTNDREYKKDLDPNGDLVGQALVAMLVGQHLNEEKWSLYGCYTKGDAWYFMTLKGKEYCISTGYFATTNAIFEIFSILKSLKQMIIDLVTRKQ